MFDSINPTKNETNIKLQHNYYHLKKSSKLTHREVTYRAHQIMVSYVIHL